jgi:hypothetical protein
VLTIFWPDWIEALTGYDPDRHDGSVEWLIVIALFFIFAVPYWRSRRGHAPPHSEGHVRLAYLPSGARPISVGGT